MTVGREHAMVKNASDRKQIKQARQMSKVVADQDSEDLRFILESEQGRRFLWRVFGHCGLYRTPAASRGDDQNKKIGMADVGRWILGEIVRLDQKYWLEMQKENLKQGDIDG